MSMTYAELSVEIAGRLKISSTDVDRFKVSDSLNHAQRYLLNTLDQRFLKNAVKTVKTDLSEDTALYQLPSDFMRHIAVWISYDAAITQALPGKYAKLVGDDDILIDNRRDPASSTYPKISYGVEGGFEIRPIPDSDQTDGLRMRYIYALPEITTTQNCLLRDNLRNLLVLYASYLAALVDGYSADLAAAYLTIFNQEIVSFLPKSEESKARKR